MWIHLKDGWRDESDEGPYTETLQTKDDWTICRLYGEQLFKLTNTRTGYNSQLPSVEEAKEYVRNVRGKELLDQFLEIRNDSSRAAGRAG